MIPSSTSNQSLISNVINTDPKSLIFTFTDYFDTQVSSFDIQHPHSSLEINSSSVVETSVADVVGDFASWHDFDAADFANNFSEFLVFTDLVDPITAPFKLQDLESPVAAIHFLNDYLSKEIKYSPGVTDVKTPASKAWALKSGVCQDFTHIALSFLRSAKIPARYISGYLYSGEGNIGQVVTGESHSWCEAWVGFWLAFDPTNGNQVLEDHILVARGRDYDDVSPLRGIYSGGQSREVNVQVKLKRLA